MAKVRTRTNLKNDDFLKSYLTAQAAGQTFEDLANETGLTALSLYQKFTKLSKAMSAEGVDLPKMPIKPKKAAVDMESLKKIAMAHLTPNKESGTLDDNQEQQYVDA